EEQRHLRREPPRHLGAEQVRDTGDEDTLRPEGGGHQLLNLSQWSEAGFTPSIPIPPRAFMPVELKPGFTPGVPRRFSSDSRQNSMSTGGSRGGILIPPRSHASGAEARIYSGRPQPIH